jgi:hypothetical protein
MGSAVGKGQLGTSQATRKLVLGLTTIEGDRLMQRAASQTNLLDMTGGLFSI